MAVRFFIALLSALALHRSSALASSLDIDLVAQIHQPLIPRPDSFINALRIITSLETSPSCHRLATSTLIDSCRSLEADRAQRDASNLALDSVKSTFAARLAVCELQGASALIPHDCVVMTAKVQSSGLKCMLPGKNCPAKGASTLLQHVEISSNQVGKCLKALESRPQWWTSYSNARQNAVVICQAARAEVEKGELLALHRSMASVASELSGDLETTLRNYARYAAEQKEFQVAVAKMQAELLQQMKDSKAELGVSMGSVAKSVEASMRFLVSKLSMGVDEVTKQMDNLNTNIQDSSQEIRSTRIEVSNLLQDVARSAADLTVSQSNELRAGRDAAIALRESLERISQGDVGIIGAAMMDLQNTVIASIQLATMMHASHSSLSGDLQSLTSHVTTLSAQFEQLHSSHLATEATQQRMHEALTSRLNATSDMLEDFAVTISTLTGSVHTTIKQVRETDLLGITLGIGNKLRNALCVLAVGCALAVLCKKAAALFVLGVSVSYMGISLLKFAPSPNSSASIDVIVIALLLASVTFGIGLWLYYSKLWNFQHRDTLGESGCIVIKAEKEPIMSEV